MTSTETTIGTEAQGVATLSPPLPRIPAMFKSGTPTDASALTDPKPSLAVGETAQALRPATESLRFPQRAHEISPALVPQAAHQIREDRICVLPKGLTFTGEAHYPCDVRIDGVVDGKMTAEPDRTITVESEGKFNGSIKATNVRIEGQVDGDITAAGGLASFGQNSVCKGHITYGRLKIAEGADVEASMKKLAA